MIGRLNQLYASGLLINIWPFAFLACAEFDPLVGVSYFGFLVIVMNIFLWLKMFCCIFLFIAHFVFRNHYLYIFFFGFFEVSHQNPIMLRNKFVHKFHMQFDLRFMKVTCSFNVSNNIS